MITQTIALQHCCSILHIGYKILQYWASILEYEGLCKTKCCALVGKVVANENKVKLTLLERAFIPPLECLRVAEEIMRGVEPSVVYSGATR